MSGHNRDRSLPGLAKAKRDAELREAFQLLDRDGDGLMRVSELRVCLVSLGVRCTEGEFRGVLTEVVRLQNLKERERNRDKEGGSQREEGGGKGGGASLRWRGPHVRLVSNNDDEPFLPGSSDFDCEATHRL